MYLYPSCWFNFYFVILNIKNVNYFYIRYEVQGYHNEVNIWFSNALARPCTLLRCSSSQYYSCLGKRGSVGMCRDVETRLNFVNEAQFLLISEESVSDLNSRLRSSMFYCTFSCYITANYCFIATLSKNNHFMSSSSQSIHEITCGWIKVGWNLFYLW